MKLFVRKRRNNRKVYLDIKARNRRELARKIGFNFMVSGEHFNVNQVYAESSSNDTASGALLGGIIGLLGGGIGVVLGGIAGGLLGKTKDDDDEKKIKHFNTTWA